MRYCFLRFPEGKFKALTLSYDDGVKADLRLNEIINRYGIKCTFNINSANIYRENKTTPDEYKKKVLPYGHEIAVHTAHHIAPGIGSPTLVIDDVLSCRKTLEEVYGGFIRGMAYPDTGIRFMHNGNTYESIKEYLKALGIVYARTLGGDNDSFMLPTDFYAWMPTAHHANPNLMAYAEKFVGLKDEGLYCASRYPRLFYLWGHSFEFDNNQSWSVLEEFCALVSGKEDTWYATNIEICEYVTAFYSLVWSADSTRVYNPTFKTVWFDADGKLYKIGAGETVALA